MRDADAEVVLSGDPRTDGRMLKITVTFDDAIPAEVQGPALLAMERYCRTMSGLDCRVFKDLKGDDSKARSLMTVEQRARL